MSLNNYNLERSIIANVDHGAEMTLQGVTKNNEHLDFDLWMREGEHTAKLTALILTYEMKDAKDYLAEMQEKYAEHEAERISQVQQDNFAMEAR